MATHIILNGELVMEQDKYGSYSNRGFLYGDGFFETMRYEKGKILFAEDHLHRIHRSLLLTEISGEGLPGKADLINYIHKLALKNGCGEYARARLSVFRNAGGFYCPDNQRASWTLQVSALKEPYVLKDKGLTIGYYTRQSKARGPFASIKSLSSQFYVMAALHAKKEKWDEALLLNTSGHIIEGISSNVFLVYNNTLITPPLSEGCVDGIIRKNILDMADKNGIPFREQIITETEVNLASELFFSNTIMGLQWVRKIGKQTYDNKLGKEVFRLFMLSLP